MKILFLASKLSETGGIEKYNKNLLKALKANKNKIFLIERRKGGLISKLLFVIGFFFKALLSKPDVVFCGHINFSPLCLFIKRIFGIEFVIFTHGIEVWNIKNNLHKKALKKTLKVISVSRFTAQKIKEQVPEIKGKQFILSNTIDSDRFYIKKRLDYLVEKYNLEDKKIIFSLARLSKSEGYKGYDRVIEAMPKVIKEVPEAIFILGGKGDDKNRVKGLIKNLDIEDNVILADFIPDEELVDYYNLADVFIMPSKGEGFGIVFLEALACGTPVIAGNQDGSIDPLQNGKVGVLINPDDKNEIAEAIISVLKEKVNQKLLNSEYLRNETLSKYSFVQFQEKFHNLINEFE